MVDGFTPQVFIYVKRVYDCFCCFINCLHFLFDTSTLLWCVSGGFSMEDTRFSEVCCVSRLIILVPFCSRTTLTILSNLFSIIVRNSLLTHYYDSTSFCCRYCYLTFLFVDEWLHLGSLCQSVTYIHTYFSHKSFAIPRIFFRWRTSTMWIIVTYIFTPKAFYKAFLLTSIFIRVYYYYVWE